MSTLLHDLVPLILVALAAGFWAHPHALALAPVSPSAGARPSVRRSSPLPIAGLHLASPAEPLKPGAAPPRFRDPLRHHRAVYGKRAKIQMWERARALALIVIIVVLLGLALSGVLIGIFVAAGFILEALASQ